MDESAFIEPNYSPRSSKNSRSLMILRAWAGLASIATLLMALISWQLQTELNQAQQTIRELTPVIKQNAQLSTPPTPLAETPQTELHQELPDGWQLFRGSLVATLAYPATAGWLFEDKGNEVLLSRPGFGPDEVVHLTNLPNTYDDLTDLENALQTRDKSCTWDGTVAGTRILLNGPTLNNDIPDLIIYLRGTGCSDSPQEFYQNEVFIIDKASGRAFQASHAADVSRHDAILEILKTADFFN